MGKGLVAAIKTKVARFRVLNRIPNFIGAGACARAPVAIRGGPVSAGFVTAQDLPQKSNRVFNQTSTAETRNST